MLELIAQDYIKALQQERLRHPNGLVATMIKNSNSDLFMFLDPEQVELIYAEYAFILQADPEFMGSEIAIRTFIAQFPYKQVFKAIDEDNKAQSEFEINTFLQLYRIENIDTGRYLLTQEMIDHLEQNDLNFVNADALSQDQNPDIRVIAENADRERIEQLFRHSEEGLYMPVLAQQELERESVQIPQTASIEQTGRTTQSTEAAAEFESTFEETPINEDLMTVVVESNEEAAQQEAQTEEETEQESIMRMRKRRQEIEAQRLRLLAANNIQQQEQPIQQEAPTNQSMTKSLLKKGLGYAMAGSGVTIAGIPIMHILEII